MLPNIFNLDSFYSSKDDLSGQNISRTKLAEDEIWQGIKLERKGDLSTAITHYRQATKLAPKSAQAYQLLSNALKKNRLKRNLPEQQINSLQEVVLGSLAQFDLSPENTEAADQEGERETGDTNAVNNSAAQALGIGLQAPIEMSIIHSLALDISNVSLIANNGNHFNTPGQPANDIVLLPHVNLTPSGELALPEALPEALSVAQVYVEQALAFFEHQQWAKSITACKEVLRVNPNMGEAYKIWGHCLQQSGKIAEARGIYAKALEIQPEIEPKLLSAQNHYDLVNNLLEEKQLDRAIACYQNCIHLEPKFLHAYSRLADALEQNGQTEKALFYYKKLARLQTGEDRQEFESRTRNRIRGFLYPSAQKSSSAIPQITTMRLPGSTPSTSIPQLQPAQNLTVEEKIDKYRQAAQQQPNSASIQFELGNCYLRSRQWPRAISYYLKAIKLAPKVARCYIYLGLAWEKSGHETKASQAYYQGFSLEPNRISAQNHFLLGNKLLEQRQVKPAFTCYRRAINLQPDLIDAYWQLGAIFMAIGNHHRAIACYQQALKVSPPQARSYLLLAKALIQTKQWQAALTCYQKATSLEPDNAAIQHHLGKILAHEQQWDDAAIAYRKAIAIKPNNSWSHHNLGHVLLQSRKWQEAALCFRQAIQLKSDFVWSHYNLAEALAKLEQWDEAAEAYRSAREIQPDLPEVNAKIAAVLHRRSKQYLQQSLSLYEAQIAEELDNVVALYHQAISLEPKNHQPYLGLGKALFKQKKLEEAISIYQMGLKLQPRNIELLIRLSEILLAKNPELGFQEFTLTA